MSASQQARLGDALARPVRTSNASSEETKENRFGRPVTRRRDPSGPARPTLGEGSGGAWHPSTSRGGTISCGDAYAGTALREATEAGLTPREVAVVLAGRPVTALVPPHPGEPLSAYADRATSELFIRYLTAGSDAVAGWT